MYESDQRRLPTSMSVNKALTTTGMETAPLSVLADATHEGVEPPFSEDGFIHNDERTLAILDWQGERYRIVASNNLKREGTVAISRVGPYKVKVEGGKNGRRVVRIEDTR